MFGPEQHGQRETRHDEDVFGRMVQPHDREIIGGAGALRARRMLREFDSHRTHAFHDRLSKTNTRSFGGAVFSTARTGYARKGGAARRPPRPSRRRAVTAPTREPLSQNRN